MDSGARRTMRLIGYNLLTTICWFRLSSDCACSNSATCDAASDRVRLLKPS